MKTAKEMASSVLRKSEERRIQQRKRITTIACSGLSMCLVIFLSIFAIGWVGNGASDRMPEPRLTVMCSAADYTYDVNLMKGVVTPIKFLIRVRDIRGINRERDIIDIIAEEASFRETTWAEETADGSRTDNIYIRSQGENAIISMLYKGTLRLELEDKAQIAEMSVRTTETGTAWLGEYRQNITEDAEEKKGISVTWSLSETTLDKIQDDPDMKLSMIQDTIMVMVSFKDGTTETVVIDVEVSDDGNVSLTHRKSEVK